MNVIVSFAPKCLILFTFTFLAGNISGQDIDSLSSDGSSLNGTLETALQERALHLQNTKARVSSEIHSVNETTLREIENKVVSLKRRLDSLKSLRLPSVKYKRKADSLYQSFREKFLDRYKLPTDTLSQKAKHRLNELDENIRENTFFLDSIFAASGLDMNLTVRDKLNLSLPQEKLPRINGPGLDLPAADQLDLHIPTMPEQDLSLLDSDLADPTSTLAPLEYPDVNTPQVNIPKTGDLPAMADIKSVQEKISDVTNVVKDVEGYAKDLEKFKELDVKDMETFPDIAEKELLKLDGVEAIKDELDKGEALKKQMATLGDQVRDPQETKEEILHRTKQPFVDHLKGKEGKVQAGMNKMFEYQKKYRVVADTRYLPKRTANKMKGKAWQERLVPGISFQVSRNHQPWTGIDISPFIGYRLSGRFRTFIGGTYRPYVNIESLDFNPDDKGFSIRWFTHIKIINGVYAHLEAERKSEYLTVRPIHQTFADQVLNKWHNRYHVGLMRLQRINKKINGAFYVLYGLDDIGETFNVNQMEMRFGFEYKLKKKKKLQAGG